MRHTRNLEYERARHGSPDIREVQRHALPILEAIPVTSDIFACVAREAPLTPVSDNPQRRFLPFA